MTIARPRTEAPRRRPPSPRLGRVGVRSGRAAFLATGPTAWYDARDLLSTSQQTLTSRVGTGSAQRGSTSGSDTNDPVALPYDGSAYIYGSRVTGNYLSVPHAANLSITDDLEIVMRLSLVDWAPNPVMTLFSKTGAAYASQVRTDGTMSLVLNSTSYATTVAMPLTANTYYWVKITRVRSSGNITFYYAADSGAEPTSWTQVGAVVAGTTAAIGAAADALGILGDTGSGGAAVGGNLKRFIIRNGVAGAGTTVLDINPAVETLGQSSWTATTGQTVTVNRSTSGLTTAVVTRPLLMADGTDDYVQLPAGDTPTFTAGAGNYTVMLINRVHNLAGAATLSRVWSSESASAVGAHIYLDQANAQYKALVGGASTVATAAATFTQTTQLHAVAAVFNAGTAYAYTTTTGLTAGADYSGVGTVTHASAPRAGSRADSAANVADFECYAVVHWTRALTATELATAATYLLGTYS